MRGQKQPFIGTWLSWESSLAYSGCPDFVQTSRNHSQRSTMKSSWRLGSNRQSSNCVNGKSLMNTVNMTLSSSLSVGLTMSNLWMNKHWATMRLPKSWQNVPLYHLRESSSIMTLHLADLQNTVHQDQRNHPHMMVHLLKASDCPQSITNRILSIQPLSTQSINRKNC